MTTEDSAHLLHTLSEYLKALHTSLHAHTNRFQHMALFVLMSLVLTSRCPSSVFTKTLGISISLLLPWSWNAWWGFVHIKSQSGRSYSLGDRLSRRMPLTSCRKTRTKIWMSCLSDSFHLNILEFALYNISVEALPQYMSLIHLIPPVRCALQMHNLYEATGMQMEFRRLEKIWQLSLVFTTLSRWDNINAWSQRKLFSLTCTMLFLSLLSTTVRLPTRFLILELMLRYLISLNVILNVRVGFHSCPYLWCWYYKSVGFTGG